MAHPAEAGEVGDEALDDGIERVDRFLIGMAVRDPRRRIGTERCQRCVELARARIGVGARIGEPFATCIVETARRAVGEVDQRQPAQRREAAAEPEAPVAASGRVKHDEKMTVYVTSDALVQLEHARLALRSQHGLAVDRGRLVREAIGLVLADLEANGAESALVRRLSEE